jgi:hypothetical protein
MSYEEFISIWDNISMCHLNLTSLSDGLFKTDDVCILITFLRNIVK